MNPPTRNGRYGTLAAAVVAVCTLIGLTRADDDPPQAKPQDPPKPATEPAKQGKSVVDQLKESKFWMDQKLQRSQAILAGLTRNDFEAIEENAAPLNILNYLEGFVRADIPEYKEQIQVFKFANAGIIKAARNKDVNAATLAYTQLVVSCVNCHNVIRASK